MFRPLCRRLVSFSSIGLPSSLFYVASRSSNSFNIGYCKGLKPLHFSTVPERNEFSLSSDFGDKYGAGAEVESEAADKTARALFKVAWDKVASEIGEDRMLFPAEVIWLGGAPGSGKGTHTEFIMKERGITAPPIICSSLLGGADVEAIKARGELVSDALVIEKLLRALLLPHNRNGVVVDGFPRTRVQVQAVLELRNKMLQLRMDFLNRKAWVTSQSRIDEQVILDSNHTYDDSNQNLIEFPRPSWRLAMLYVDEQTSVDRQLWRGKMSKLHNARVRETGFGVLQEERDTDFDEAKVRLRYDTFRRQTWASLTRLSDVFQFHLIDARPPIQQVQENISDEFGYQSGLELSSETLDLLSSIPEAAVATARARQELVERLDNYSRFHADVMTQVVAVVQYEILPTVNRHIMAGKLRLRTKNPFLLSSDMACDMVVAVLSERGYYVSLDDRPARLDTVLAIEIARPATDTTELVNSFNGVERDGVGGEECDGGNCENADGYNVGKVKTMWSVGHHGTFICESRREKTFVISFQPPKHIRVTLDTEEKDDDFAKEFADKIDYANDIIPKS